MKFVRQIPRTTLRHSPANVFEDYDIVEVIRSICRFYIKSIAGTRRNPSFHLSLVTFDITTCSRERGGRGVGDPFITPSPTLLIISIHIPTQWDVCTIVIAHKEKYTEFQQLNILLFIFQGMEHRFKHRTKEDLRRSIYRYR